MSNPFHTTNHNVNTHFKLVLCIKQVHYCCDFFLVCFHVLLLHQDASNSCFTHMLLNIYHGMPYCNISDKSFETINMVCTHRVNKHLTLSLGPYTELLFYSTFFLAKIIIVVHWNKKKRILTVTHEERCLRFSVALQVCYP